MLSSMLIVGRIRNACNFRFVTLSFATPLLWALSQNLWFEGIGQFMTGHREMKHKYISSYDYYLNFVFPIEWFIRVVFIVMLEAHSQNIVSWTRITNSLERFKWYILIILWLKSYVDVVLWAFGCWPISKSLIGNEIRFIHSHGSKL